MRRGSCAYFGGGGGPEVGVLRDCTSILSRSCVGKIVYIKKEGCQDQSLVNAISQTSMPASLAITSGEGEASISDKLQDHFNHVLIWQKSQQLAGKAAVPDNVISCCRVKKHGTCLLLSLKRVLDILREQNGLVHD